MMDEALKTLMREAVREALEQERPALVAQLRAELRAESPDPWLSTAAAAKHAGVEPDTIRDWCAEGMKHGRSGKALRVRRSVLDAWIQKGRTKDEVVNVDNVVTSILGRLKK